MDTFYGGDPARRGTWWAPPDANPTRHTTKDLPQLLLLPQDLADFAISRDVTTQEMGAFARAMTLLAQPKVDVADLELVLAWCTVVC